MTRFGRDSARNSLFAGYDAARTQSASPAKAQGFAQDPRFRADASSNPYSGSANPYAQSGPAANGPKFRSATPNAKGQYSDALLNELESQNDQEVEGMSAKVQMLKQV